VPTGRSAGWAARLTNSDPLDQRKKRFRLEPQIANFFLMFQSRIDSMLSSTLRMKQAERCGFSSKPTLNQTGRLRVLI
jgi:hypothetical protein